MLEKRKLPNEKLHQDQSFQTSKITELIQNLSIEPDATNEDIAKNLIEKLPQTSLSTRSFITRIYQQAKQISQIIAYIWLWADDKRKDKESEKETARALRTYFDKPTENIGNVGGNLKKLLGADPKAETLSEEGQLLKDVFGELIDDPNFIFPIFDNYELCIEDSSHGYLFKVNVNSFNGRLDDPDSSTPHLFTFNIPFPQRPTLDGAELSRKDLKEWIKDDEGGKYFADNPYIPTTCS